MNPLPNKQLGLAFQFFSLSFIILVISACGTTLRRYKSVAYGGPDNKLATIHLSKAQVEVPDKDDTKNIWQLAAQGQAELIKDLNKRADTSDDKFNAALNGKYFEKDAPAHLDYLTKNLQLIFSVNRKLDYKSLGVENSRFSLADRIESLDFSLLLDTASHLKFTKWNKYATEYGSIDIGDMSFTRSLSVTAGVGDTSGTTPYDLSATGSASKTETQHIKYRYIQLSGTLDENKLSIQEQGEREIDLAGNILANVTLKYKVWYQPVYKFKSLKDDKGNYKTPNKLDVAPISADVPAFINIPDTLRAKLIFHYTYRHVTNRIGARSFYENDDRVTYYTGSDTAKVALFAADEIFPSFYTAGDKINNDDSKWSKNPLLIKTKMIQQLNQPMVFTSYNDALDFMNWLEAYCANVKPGDLDKPISLGKQALFIGDDNTQMPDKPLTAKMVNDQLNWLKPHKFITKAFGKI